MKKVIVWIVALAVIAVAVGLWGYRSFYGNCVRTERELFVRSGSDYQRIADSLAPAINHRWAFNLYARHINLPATFKAGHYVVREPMSVIEVARMLKLGLQTPVNVVIQNARTRELLAGKLSRQIEADSLTIVRAFQSDALARELGFDSLRLYSMFIPNTYEFYWTVEPEDIVRRMRREYDAFWTPERDKARGRSGLSRYEVMTLASIVYSETRAEDEMPTVAGLYLNRIKRGIPLQADPTVVYAWQDFTLRRLYRRHLEIDSPYNTYKVKGLPPSPICMPSIPAIESVLNFEPNDYIFMCARPTFDGHHNFARTLAEHNANAKAYVRELNKKGIK